MIIENKDPKKDDVVLFRTTAGDEVIAKLVKIDPSELVLKKPYQMQLMMGPGGQGNVAMVPYMVGASEDGEFVVSRHHIITMVKPRKEAIEQYIKQTTGLSLATSMPTGINI